MQPVHITAKNYRCFDDEHPLKFTFKPGRCAIVGPNNSGKSTAIRFAFDFRPLFSRFAERANAHLGFQFGHLSEILHQTPDFMRVFCRLNSRPMQVRFDFIDTEHDHPCAFEFLADRGDGSVAWKFYRNRELLELDAVNLAAYVQGQCGHELNVIAASCQPLAQTLYFGPFRNAINIGADPDYYDVKIGSQLADMWDGLKTGEHLAGQQLTARLEKQIARVFSFPNLQIMVRRNKQRLLVVVDGDSFDLEDLGAGLSQFIIVLLNVAVKKPGFVLIDEPESHLHPSAQLRLLEAIEEYVTEGVIFATHSYGLTHMANRSFSMTKETGKGSILRDLDETTDLAEFLGEMSFSSYRDVGAEAFLFVEGSTDIGVLRHFLRQAEIEHKVFVFPLGGATMINANRYAALEQMRRLGVPIHLLIDSERTEAGAALEESRQAFVRDCERLDYHIHALDRRAIENYLVERAIHEYKGLKYRELEQFEKRSDADPCWSKDENEQIAKLMTLSDLDGTDLHAFIQRIRESLE